MHAKVSQYGDSVSLEFGCTTTRVVCATLGAPTQASMDGSGRLQTVTR